MDRYGKCFWMGAMLIVASTAAGQTAKSAKGVRLERSPVIDGILSEGEWPEAARLEGFVDPLTGRPGPEETIGYLGYDAQAIYVAFRCRDSRPEGMRARETGYGAGMDDDDHVVFLIHPYGLRSWDGMNTFKVNLINTQADRLAGGRASKREWRGFWQSATTKDGEGWSAEMRIPWEMLRYDAGNGKNLDINLARYHARTRVTTQWSNMGIQQRPEFMGMWIGVDLPPVRADRRPLTLAYLAPGINGGQARVRAGFDVRSPLTDESNALLSINPDFENIEGQVAGIEFTRTERILADTRPFFDEGDGFFKLTGEFGYGQMFYSNRIRQFDVGAKAFGKLDRITNFGILTTYQSGGQRASVGNVSFNPGPNGSGNLFFTHSSQPGRHNTVVGGGLTSRKGNWAWSGSASAVREPGSSTKTAGTVSMDYSVPNLSSTARYYYVDRDFNPALGYVGFTGRRGGYIYTEHERDFRKGPVRGFDMDLFLPRFWDYSGRLQNQGYEASMGVSTWSDIRVKVWHRRTEFYDERDAVDGLRLRFNNSNPFKRFGVSYQNGYEGGLPSSFTSLFGGYRFGKVDLGISQSILERGGSSRLTVGTVSWEISPTRSLAARTVVRDGKSNSYLSFRNAGGRGLEYFVILGDPNADRWKDRLSVKLVWAF